MKIIKKEQFTLRIYKQNEEEKFFIKGFGIEPDGGFPPLPEGSLLEEKQVIPSGTLIFDVIPEVDAVPDTNNNIWFQVI